LRLHLANGAEPSGAHLENLVLHDLLVWRDARLERADVFYWRTADGHEVDFVVEAGGRLLPIEVKATTRPRLADAVSVHTFRTEYKKQARAALLLHAGDAVQWIAPHVLAAPWWKVL
jgi:predicted AAA+ superfamily ATPase